MNIGDFLGDLGYGFIGANNAYTGMQQNIDKATQSGLTTDRLQQQYDADVAANLFNNISDAEVARYNYLAQVNRSGINGLTRGDALADSQNQLALAKLGDERYVYSPEFRQQVAALSSEYDVSTPEFQSRLAQLYAAQGMVPQARQEMQLAQDRNSANDYVLATAQKIDPEITQLRVVNGRLYGMSVDGISRELPLDAIVAASTLGGNNKPLAYSQARARQDMAVRAGLQGQYGLALGALSPPVSGAGTARTAAVPGQMTAAQQGAAQRAQEGLALRRQTAERQVAEQQQNQVDQLRTRINADLVARIKAVAAAEFVSPEEVAARPEFEPGKFATEWIERNRAILGAMGVQSNTGILGNSGQARNAPYVAGTPTRIAPAVAAQRLGGVRPPVESKQVTGSTSQPPVAPVQYTPDLLGGYNVYP